MIVDDDLPTLDSLSKLLKTKLQKVEIIAADTISLAIIQIDESFKKRKPIDVAILDFRLPQEINQPDEIDESICFHLREKSPETYIIHFTAYVEDKQVIEHIREYHNEPNMSSHSLVSKNETSYPVQIINLTLKFIKSREVQTKYDEIFQPKNYTNHGTIQLRWQEYFGDQRYSQTRKIAILCSEIEKNWEYLNENLRRKIKSVLAVDESSDHVKVSLL
jgi:hypothetical protein